MHPTADHEPTGVAVALAMASKSGDGEHGLPRRQISRQRPSGDRAQDIQLCPGESPGGGRVSVVAGKVPEEQKTPGHGCKNGQSV